MYLSWDKKIITDWSEEHIYSLYNEGYLFTREGRGTMYQTRSLRVDLAQFELSSENRRVLKKTEPISLEAHPLPYAHYHFSIGKLGKDFYETKFGPKIFSANKIKELLTAPEKNNFNTVLVYSLGGGAVGYAICYQNSELVHYVYPFYRLDLNAPNLGIGMMTKALLWAKENRKKYIYLGSFQRPSDTYKLQFTGVEWWGGKKWKADTTELKKITHA